MSLGSMSRVRFALWAAVLIALLLAAPRCARWAGLTHAEGVAALAAHQPLELVAGGNEPPAPRVAPELEKLDAQALAAAADYAQAHDSRALIVSRNDHIVFERYWHGTGFNTLADAQSFTQLLAALAIGTAMSHRLIGWPDEPLSAFISEWSQDPRGAIPLRSLMQLSSGLGPAAPGAPPTDLLAATLATPLATAPTTRRLEKPADAQLLALVLERVTHQRYAQYLSQALWRRVGAGNAWLWLDRPAGTAHADCCMVARQGDWIRIGQLMVRDGNYRGAEVIRPGWVTLMRSPSKADADYGAFVRLASWPGQEQYATRDVFVVEGSGGNRLWLVPSMQIAILCTGDAAGRDPHWDDSRIPNLILRAAHDYLPPAAQPGADISSMVPGHP